MYGPSQVGLFSIRVNCITPQGDHYPTRHQSGRLLVAQGCRALQHSKVGSVLRTSPQRQPMTLSGLRRVKRIAVRTTLSE
jgi:hypothetical protein